MPKGRRLQKFYFKYFLEDRYHAIPHINTNNNISIINIVAGTENVYKSGNDAFKLLSTKINITVLNVNAEKE